MPMNDDETPEAEVSDLSLSFEPFDHVGIDAHRQLSLHGR